MEVSILYYIVAVLAYLLVGFFTAILPMIDTDYTYKPIKQVWKRWLLFVFITCFWPGYPCLLFGRLIIWFVKDLWRYMNEAE